MGLNFRKSINLGGGVKLNVGKKGIGISAGDKGARVSVSKKGVKATESVPGTGISYSMNKPTNANNVSHASSLL